MPKFAELGEPAQQMIMRHVADLEADIAEAFHDSDAVPEEDARAVTQGLRLRDLIAAGWPDTAGWGFRDATPDASQED